jgi:hypothetical protein
MRRLLQVWREDDGVLSFEWVLLVTLVTIGVVGGLAAARDAIIDEMGDVAEAAQGIDQSYTLSPLNLTLTINGIPFTGNVGGANGSFFTETAADQLYSDCVRVPAGSLTQEALQDDHGGLEATSGT